MPTKVLVFESDVTFAEELREGLSQLGCETTVVDDASVGLSTAARNKPDLILLAIELPRMNGFSVCNKLKRDPGLKDVPLIIMSTESTEETFEQHRRLRTRAEDYVRKPIGFEDLLARIRTFVPLDNDSTETFDADELLIEDIEIEEEVTDADVEPEQATDRAFDSILAKARPSEPTLLEENIEIAEAEVLSEPPPSSFLPPIEMEAPLDISAGPDQVANLAFAEAEVAPQSVSPAGPAEVVASGAESWPAASAPPAAAPVSWPVDSAPRAPEAASVFSSVPPAERRPGTTAAESESKPSRAPRWGSAPSCAASP